jgi:sugar phosphate isomerase/epimerase
MSYNKRIKQGEYALYSIKEDETMPLPVAVQIYSVRDDAARDLRGTLEAIKGMGYDGVEFAGLYGYAPADIKRMCEDIGLVPISAHVPYVDMVNDACGVLSQYAEIGCSYVAVPYLMPEHRPDSDAFPEVVDNIGKIALVAKELGIQLLYHNHNFEMVECDGKRRYDWLFETMGEDELQPEIDTGWIELEVGEAEQYIRKFKNRCDLVHIKSYYAKDGFDGIAHSPDTTKPRETFDFCNYERGRLDVLAIVKASLESGAKWLVVEQDRPDVGLSELESAKINIDYLKKL